MSIPEAALAELDVLEGGRCNIAGDHGGSTAFGISLRFLRGLPNLAGDVNGDGEVTADDIRALTYEKAGAFFDRYFWRQYGCDQIADQRVAIRMFTIFVNMRPLAAGHVMQRALRAAGIPVIEDGVVGPKTRDAINALDPLDYMPAVRSEQAGHYRLIVAHDPTQQQFKAGWLNRAYRQ